MKKYTINIHPSTLEDHVRLTVYNEKLDLEVDVGDCHVTYVSERMNRLDKMMNIDENDNQLTLF